MAAIDESKMLAYVEQCEDPDKLWQLIKNARQLDALQLAAAAFRKLVSIVPSEQPGTVEHDFWQSIQAFEYLLSEENGRTTRLQRTRQKVSRVGILATLADWAAAGHETRGFQMLMERGMPELSGEAVVLRHPDRFAEDVVAAARGRLKAAGVDIAAVLRAH